MLTYGCVVWAKATETNTMKKKLEKLQRLGLTSIATVRKGTPTAALEIIYNTPPLYMLLRERALSTLLRLGPQQEVNWQPITSTKWGHIQELRRDLPADLSDDMLPLPEHNRDQPYETLIHHDSAPQTLGVRVYTDGSLMNGCSGSGVFIQTNEYQVTLRERLSTCTVFHSELYAIQMACEFLFTQNTQGEHINFHVDSQAALHAVASPCITSKVVKDTVKLLQYLSQDNTVHLQWVKAHVGIEGNEQADAAAKAGSRVAEQYTHKHFPTTRNSMKARIRQMRNAAWANKWLHSEEYRQSKDFLQGPHPGIWADLKHKPAQTLSRTIRFVTGHCYMNRHNTLLRFGYDGLAERSEVTCRLCETGEETPFHLITTCPVMITTRLSTLYVWQLDTPPPWSKDLINFINSPHIISLEENAEYEQGM